MLHINTPPGRLIFSFSNILRRSISSTEQHGIFKFASVNNKSYLKIRGPDSVKFLNGLVTSKLQPTFIKKNLTTISPDDQVVNPDTDDPIYAIRMNESNWGLYKEKGKNGSYITRFGQYTGFLNGKGKLVTDSILYPTPVVLNEPSKYPEYLLEFDNKMIEKLLGVIQTHKLSSKFKCEKVEKTKTWDVLIQFPNIPKEVENPWIDNVLEPESVNKTPEFASLFSRNVVSTLFPNQEENIIGLYIERRTDRVTYNDGGAPQMFRVVTSQNISDISEIFNINAFPFRFDIENVDESHFRSLRFQSGYVDSIVDVKPETVLPLELNFDYIPNAVSSNKGCYVGQELTARTFSTGILRKRLVPVKIVNPELLPKDDTSDGKYLEVQMKSQDAKESNPLPLHDTIHNPFHNSNSQIKKRKRPAGSLIAHESNNGVMMMRTENFSKVFDLPERAEDTFYIETTSKNGESSKVFIVPQKPDWYDRWKRENNNIV